MARVLMGWELGANRGHVHAMDRIARRLIADGHEVVYALQQIDAAGIDFDPRIALWQAPVWPRLLVGLAQRYGQGSTTMGDILGRVGLDRPGALAAMIRSWDAIMAAVQPDLVIADFAPALLSAARGRVASVMTGTGFTCPHADLAAFPRLDDGSPPACDEDELLDIADADLRAVGREPLAGLPQLFAADHVAIAAFAALDPYADLRPGVHAAPNIDAGSLIRPGGGGEEIFVYFFQLAPSDAPLWEGLAATGRKVRIHFSDPTRDHRLMFKRLGFAFEPNPLPLARIAARSRLALSHGGHGFVSSCLVAGLPQLVAWYDLEKKLIGACLQNAGLGVSFSFHRATVRSVAETVDAAWNDAGCDARCRQAAPAFMAAMDDRVEDRIAGILAGQGDPA